MKIIISYPPLQGKGSPMLTQNRQFQWYHEPSYIYPVVMASAATLLQKHDHAVIWNDCIAQHIKWNGFLTILKKEKPDLLVFETKTPVVRQHWYIINQVKKHFPKIKTVLLGDHVTALPKESMKTCHVDFIITGGDYDTMLLALLNHLQHHTPLPKGVWYRKKGEILSTGPYALTKNLNTLPIIDRTRTKAHLYGEKWKKRTPFFYTMAGRDCWWKKCTFCSWTTLFPTFRTQTPKRLLDEIGYLIDTYDAKELFDDTGTFPIGNWLKTFCQGMIDRGYNEKILFSANMRFGCLDKKTLLLMKQAGFRKLKIGLESGNQYTLDRIHKGITVEQIKKDCKMISETGLDIHLTIMVGYPWETKKDAHRTYILAKELMEKGYIEMLQSTIVIPYPGTPLYKEAVKNKWFTISPTDYDSFDMSKPILKTPDMTPSEIEQLCRDIYALHFNIKFILQRITQSNPITNFPYFLRGIQAIIGHLKDFQKSV